MRWVLATDKAKCLAFVVLRGFEWTAAHPVFGNALLGLQGGTATRAVMLDRALESMGVGTYYVAGSFSKDGKDCIVGRAWFVR